MCCGEQVSRPRMPISGESPRRQRTQLRSGVGFQRRAAADALVRRTSQVGGFSSSFKRYYPRGGSELATVRESALE